MFHITRFLVQKITEIKSEHWLERRSNCARTVTL